MRNRIMNLHTQHPKNKLSSFPLFSRFNDEMSHFLSNKLPVFKSQRERRQWQPDVDVEQRNNEYVVTIDVPGVDIEDIKVYMDEGALNIEGKKESKLRQKLEEFLHIERRCGSFHRCISLPNVAEYKAMKAFYDKGTLEIKVPKVKETKQKTIPVIFD